jgi:histidine ammonia-lyase
VINSDAFGPLTAELRRAEAHFVDVTSLLPRVVAARGIEGAQDIAAVLRARVAAAVSRDTGAGRTRRAPRLVAGLIPRALGPMGDAMRQALVERADLIESRAAAVLDNALLAGEPWTRALDAARALVALKEAQRLAEYRRAFDAPTRIPIESLRLPADIRF